jgi:hypothetical protein
MRVVEGGRAYELPVGVIIWLSRYASASGKYIEVGEASATTDV